MVYEVGFTIFLRALDLFLGISLSFLGLFHFMSLRINWRQGVSGWHDELLLGGKTGNLSES